MKKITIDNVFEKEQHRGILDYLEKYPEGLESSEILYLLSNRYVSKVWKKEKKFKKESRRDIIPSSQRLLNIIAKLKQEGLVYKDRKRYKLPNFSSELKSLNENIKILEHYSTLIKYHFSVYRDIKHLNKKYQRFGLEPPRRYKKDGELIINSIIRPELQIYGINIDSIPEKQLYEAIKMIKNGMKIIKDARNEQVKEKSETRIERFKSFPLGPKDKYLKLREYAIQGRELDVPDEDASLEEFKEWENKRVEKVISENIKLQESFNITIILNSNKDKILKINI